MTTAVAGSIVKPPRRSVRSLSVQEKVHAIDRVHEGESKASVARDIGVPESTLRGWCKGEEKLRGIVARSNGGGNSSSILMDTSNSLDESFEKVGKYNLTEGLSQSVVSITNQKRDYFSSLDEAQLQQQSSCTIGKKLPKLDMKTNNDVPMTENFEKVSNQRNCDESPINFSKDGENDLTVTVRKSYSPDVLTTPPAGAGAEKTTTSTSTAVSAAAAAAAAAANSHKSDESQRDVQNLRNPALPALAAIASAISNKNQLLYNAYTNGILRDMIPKEELINKPLDYSKKVTSRLPRNNNNVNETLMLWLQSQREQASMPMSPLEARTADSSSWFWKLYKNYGILTQVRA